MSESYRNKNAVKEKNFDGVFSFALISEEIISSKIYSA
jgi:hypothetical protein